MLMTTLTTTTRLTTRLAHGIRRRAACFSHCLLNVLQDGCMAIDSLYNVYNIVDPVACCLNACVDVDYAKVVKPLPISSVTSSMLSEYTAKVSEFFSSLLPSWPSSTDKASHSDHHQQQQDPTASLKSPPTSQMTGGSAQDSANSNTQQQQQQRPAQRPKTKRQITSEFGTEELRRFERAEKRMLALNPQGSIDFYLTNEGFSAYYEMLISHASYWHDPRFTSFVSRPGLCLLFLPLPCPSLPFGRDGRRVWTGRRIDLKRVERAREPSGQTG